MAEEEKDTAEETSEKKSKFDLNLIKERLQNIDFKDKKVIGILSGIAVLLLILLYLLFSGGEEPADVVEEEEAMDLIQMTQKKAEVYIPLTAGEGSKATEFMATINEDDRVLKFSAALGLESELLLEVIPKHMAPLLSATLRFLSRMSKEEILEMLQGEDEGQKMRELIQHLNRTLRNNNVDLKATGGIAQVNFTTYYFPNI